MSDSVTGRRWGFLVAEAVLIVLSILLAFAIDAWWEGRGEREAEVRHLHALQEDMDESRALLLEFMEERERLFHSLERILAADLAEAPPDSVARWIHDGLWMLGTYEARLTSIRDLEASGQLRLLSPEVRRAIADLNRSLSSAEAVQGDFSVSQQRLLDTWLVEELPLLPLLVRADALDVDAVLPAEPDWSPLEREEARSRMGFKLSLGRVTMGAWRLALGRMEGLDEAAGRRLAELGETPAS